jgi:RecB family exonuclease
MKGQFLSFFLLVHMARVTSFLLSHRCTAVFASKRRHAASLAEELQQEPLAITMPTALSPSSIQTFRDCPQSFLFQYIYKIKQPVNAALTTGTLCHAALEQIFDLPASDRTLHNLQNLFRQQWAQKRLQADYRHLFHDQEQHNREAEIAWGQYSLSLLKQYFEYENPAHVERPNPLQREVWVRAHIPFEEEESFLVRGIVDRFDMVRDSQNNIVLRLLDYKTGKAPQLKYSPAMNQKIRDEAFEQLKIYALLYQGELPLRYLRLLFLTSPSGRAVAMDWDLGATPEERHAVLQPVQQGLVDVYQQIRALVELQDPTAWKGCNRSFCYCHTCRPQFAAGSVWAP